MPLGSQFAQINLVSRFSKDKRYPTRTLNVAARRFNIQKIRRRCFTVKQSVGCVRQILRRDNIVR